MSKPRLARLHATGDLGRARIDMGILRYIIQGAGWEVGRQAAREGIDALAEANDESAAETVTDPGVARRRERALRAAAKKQRAELERQLAEMKKRAGR